MFDIALSLAQFQRMMVKMIFGLPGEAAYVDDLIITGATESEYWKKSNQVSLVSE